MAIFASTDIAWIFVIASEAKQSSCAPAGAQTKAETAAKCGPPSVNKPPLPSQPMWKRILLAYVAVALIAFVVWMVPVTKQIGKKAFWPQAWKVTQQSALWPYAAFRHVVKY